MDFHLTLSNELSLLVSLNAHRIPAGCTVYCCVQNGLRHHPQGEEQWLACLYTSPAPGTIHHA